MTFTKRQKIIITVVVLIALGVLWYFMNKPATEPTTATATNAGDPKADNVGAKIGRAHV